MQKNRISNSRRCENRRDDFNVKIFVYYLVHNETARRNQVKCDGINRSHYSIRRDRNPLQLRLRHSPNVRTIYQSDTEIIQSITTAASNPCRYNILGFICFYGYDIICICWGDV